ncbi:hypothetical protein [Actinophytocola glycyrrhizae]|uniref:PE family protein n=1 Tax=Actinophytocola glycyrrhizae TaxID=2044873 RepID=A0ABV9SAM1_9PSEU
MELEGDSPAPRPPAAPTQGIPPSLHVTPENVVTLAATFRRCADRLERQLPHLDADLALKAPWLDDPVSGWAQERFNEYFVRSEHAFVQIVHSEYEQHKALRDALVATAKLYGLTEELISAGFTDVEAER